MIFKEGDGLDEWLQPSMNRNRMNSPHIFIAYILPPPLYKLLSGQKGYDIRVSFI